MATAPPHIGPQQDWAAVEGRLRAEDAIWLRALSFDDRFALYQDLLRVLLEARRTIPGDWERLEEWHWKQKLDLRRQSVEAFSKLDQWRSERATAGHPG